VQPTKHERFRKRLAEQVPDPEADARLAAFFARMGLTVPKDEGQR
jgi:hypothetical protein